MRKITLYPAPDCPYGPSETTLYLDSDFNAWPRLTEALEHDLEIRADWLHSLDVFWGGNYDEDHSIDLVYEAAPNGHREIIGSIDRQLTADEWREVRRVFPKELRRAA
ncbi:MAG: hypothetical protein P4L76_17950 [Beijerinckiaceae bacterium]|nr:hypothetical protein [Beijerinckiaceae bacterium]